jgi:putative ABC transport system permease protein
MEYNRYASLAGTQGRARLMLVDVSERLVPRIDVVVKAIERQFDSEGIDVKMVYQKLEYKVRMVDHLVVITSMLIMMTLLIILVGGLGIVTTMGINIIERKREIGILRAIGTGNRLLYRILMYEGITTGLIAWVCSAILALPMSYYLGNFFFSIFFETTINFTVSPVGIVAWFFINLIFSSVAVLIPARNAARMSVASALVYE